MDRVGSSLTVLLVAVHRWPSVAAAAKKAYGLRYQLLTYLYGELFLAHIRGGTLARPLLFADPADLLARYALCRVAVPGLTTDPSQTTAI